MRPVVAIVGRPNAGKSTLFNRILGRKKALVARWAGLTRDLNYADTEELGRTFTIVDTGGFTSEAEDEIAGQVKLQTRVAIEDADLIVFLMDGHAGLTHEDMEIAGMLRRAGKPVFYAVNKIDSQGREKDVADFYRLGVDEIYPLSAEHGRGVNELIDAIVEKLPAAAAEEADADRIRVAIVGRPNVGKSSILNRLIGRSRALVSGVAGTTRDAVDTPFDHDGTRYLFVDTAGIRRKSKISLTVETYSVMEAIKAIERSHVAVLVIDAEKGLMGQDLRIAGIIEDKKRCCIIAVNKWDLVEKDTDTALRIEQSIKREMPFLSFAPVVFISALTGQRLEKVFGMINDLFTESSVKVPTPRLNTVLKEITSAHRPDLYRGRAVKFFYAAQTGTRPPAFVVFVNHPQALKESYKRYILNSLRPALAMERVPIKIHYRERH